MGDKSKVPSESALLSGEVSVCVCVCDLPKCVTAMHRPVLRSAHIESWGQSMRGRLSCASCPACTTLPAHKSLEHDACLMQGGLW